MDVDPWPYVTALALGLGIGFGGSFLYGFVNRLRETRWMFRYHTWRLERKERRRWTKPGDQ